MNFIQDMIYTGQEPKISVKTQKPYILVNLLDDTGKTITCIAEQIEKNLVMLQHVRVAFKLDLGKYTSLRALDVSSID